MDQLKKGFLPVLQGVKLSSAQCPTMAEDIEEMSVTPYASAIGSIKYAMVCTKPIVYLAMSLARGYDIDLGVDHLTTVKIILRRLRRYFSVMEVIKSLSDRGKGVPIFR